MRHFAFFRQKTGFQKTYDVADQRNATKIIFQEEADIQHQNQERETEGQQNGERDVLGEEFPHFHPAGNNHVAFVHTVAAAPDEVSEELQENIADGRYRHQKHFTKFNEVCLGTGNFAKHAATPFKKHQQADGGNKHFRKRRFRHTGEEQHYSERNVSTQKSFFHGDKSAFIRSVFEFFKNIIGKSKAKQAERFYAHLRGIVHRIDGKISLNVRPGKYNTLYHAQRKRKGCNRKRSKRRVPGFAIAVNHIVENAEREAGKSATHKCGCRLDGHLNDSMENDDESMPQEVGNRHPSLSKLIPL